MDFPCVNCRQNAGCFIVYGVLVCDSCQMLVQRVQENLTRELHQLHALAGEAVRLALVEGRLHMSEKGSAEEISKTELLKAISALPTLKGD